MYTLTLTKGEREAIDWVGDCYSNGIDLFLLLDVPENGPEWDEPGDITFQVPEHVASVLTAIRAATNTARSTREG